MVQFSRIFSLPHYFIIFTLYKLISSATLYIRPFKLNLVLIPQLSCESFRGSSTRDQSFEGLLLGFELLTLDLWHYFDSVVGASTEIFDLLGDVVYIGLSDYNTVFTQHITSCRAHLH